MGPTDCMHIPIVEWCAITCIVLMVGVLLLGVHVWRHWNVPTAAVPVPHLRWKVPPT
jgi:hypothetical protein